MKNESQCHNKRSYYSMTEASIAAFKARERRGVKLRVYPCPNCRQYHLTKKDAQ